MTQLGRYILPRPYKNSKDTEEVYQLLGGGNRENVEVSEDLAGHAAKGLRLWLEHKVLDEDAELVESDTEPGLVYWWDREAKLFKRGWMGPDGLEKTQDLDPGYFNRGQRVRYSSHHFACIFALGYDVIIPITPKSTDAIQRETAYAEAYPADRKAIRDAYDARRAEFRAGQETGRQEYRQNMLFGWQPKSPGCQKLEKMLQGKKFPVEVYFRRNSTTIRRPAGGIEHAHASLAWTVFDGWEPVEVKEVAEVKW